MILCVSVFTLPLTIMCLLFEGDTGKKIIYKLAEAEEKLEDILSK